MVYSTPNERIGDRLRKQRALHNLTYGSDLGTACAPLNRQPQCLMHEASTPADVTHLELGSE